MSTEYRQMMTKLGTESAPQTHSSGHNLADLVGGNTRNFSNLLNFHK